MEFKKISSKSQIGNEPAYLIDSEEKEIRRILDTLKAQNKKPEIAVLGRDEEFNRRAIETLKINYLVSPEIQGKDTLKQRGSGLNHYLVKEAAKKNISIVIDFDSIKKLDKDEKTKRLARVIQNIKLCRKAKCKIIIWSSTATKYDLQALGFSLGMSSQQVSIAL